MLDLGDIAERRFTFSTPIGAMSARVEEQAATGDLGGLLHLDITAIEPAE